MSTTTTAGATTTPPPAVMPRRGRPGTPAGRLTPTQHRAVAEIARGGGYAEVARRLGTPEAAVRDALARARERLGASSTAHLVALAIGQRQIPAGVALGTAAEVPNA